MTNAPRLTPQAEVRALQRELEIERAYAVGLLNERDALRSGNAARRLTAEQCLAELTRVEAERDALYQKHDDAVRALRVARAAHDIERDALLRVLRVARLSPLRPPEHTDTAWATTQAALDDALAALPPEVRARLGEAP